MKTLLTLVIISFSALTSSGVLAQKPSVSDSDVFSSSGYRQTHYRAPTPSNIDNAQVLTAKELKQLIDKRPVALLDVQPSPWKHGFFVAKEPRLHVPGSVWLPNVGYGELEKQWEDYYKTHLSKVSNGNKDYPIVIYCSADCWMSWNAIKRAAEWGYTQLYWFRNGSDGWLEAGLPTVTGKPEPMKYSKKTQ